MACFIDDHRESGAKRIIPMVEDLIQTLKWTVDEARRAAIAVCSTRHVRNPLTASPGPDELKAFADKMEHILQKLGELSPYDFSFLAEAQALADLRKRLDYHKAGLLLFNKKLVVRPPAERLMREIIDGKTPLKVTSSLWDDGDRRTNLATCHKGTFYNLGLLATARILEGITFPAHNQELSASSVGKFTPPVQPRAQGVRMGQQNQKLGAMDRVTGAASSEEAPRKKRKQPQEKESSPPYLAHPTPTPAIDILQTAQPGYREVLPDYCRPANDANRAKRKEKYNESLRLIQQLMDCDNFENISTLRDVGEAMDHLSPDKSDKLCRSGDRIVLKLVEWTRRLPFYDEIPVEIHTRLLTNRWHELLVLTTSAYQAIYGTRQVVSTHADDNNDTDNQDVITNLVTLQSCLTSIMGKPIPINQLQQDAGTMVEKITKVTTSFRKLQLSKQEYVCLKVVVMLTQDGSTRHQNLESIKSRYMGCLRTFAEHNYPQHPSRVEEILAKLPQVQQAAGLLLESRMFYVPFLLNSTINSVHPHKTMPYQNSTNSELPKEGDEPDDQNDDELLKPDEDEPNTDEDINTEILDQD